MWKHTVHKTAPGEVDLQQVSFKQKCQTIDGSSLSNGQFAGGSKQDI